MPTDGAIFFDLDGTLTDPKPGITGSIQYALRKLGHPVPSQDELTWCIGPPLRGSFVTLLGGEELADHAVALYRERFGDVGLFENAVYPDIAQVLAALRQGPRRMFVATSKPHMFATRIIAHFGLSGYFDQVFGSELDGTRVNKVELLAYALEQTGADPARAVMIGDRSHDVIGANKNGIRAVGVTYGYGTAKELVEAGASHLCASPRAVLDHIHSSFG
ncbi:MULTISPECIES: HAD family hydrolase [unclassified Bradyrhizobium]|uniref:HAD family hydrolase n=1 Tax=unclassified Bradyrhizobium TaxID=2631580 RepID=UPI002479838F|nr:MULTISPECIES: HAD family hydrolase [unclassified Bradyrhizobium]WGS22298.1 HAD family hydrolase [Bradyrhizobium sp. ISRA463]WGS29270.1 HAD family hydrolase [Bradyrhizobium sp. ISRA464]